MNNIIKKYTRYCDELKFELFNKFIKTKESDKLFQIYNSIKTPESEYNQECNGQIYDKQTMKLVCTNQLNFTKNVSYENINSIEYCEDGTLLRCYYTDKWNIATSKCINAETSYWSSTKSFKQLFDELFENSLYDKLDEQYTYLFILNHKENIHIVKHLKNVLVYIGKIKNDNPRRIPDNSDYSKLFKEPIVLPETIKTDNIERDILLNLLYTDLKRGILIKYNNGELCKIDFKDFETLKNIRGNTPYIRIRYLELLKDQSLLNEFIKHYSTENHMMFTMIEYCVMNTVSCIYKVYVDTHIKHLYVIDNTHMYTRIIKQLHASYHNTKKSIQQIDVYNKFIALPIVEMMIILGWNVNI